MTLPTASLGTQTVPTFLRKGGVSCSFFIHFCTPQAAGNITLSDLKFTYAGWDVKIPAELKN